MNGSGSLDDLFSPEALQALALPSGLPTQNLEELFTAHENLPLEPIPKELGEGTSFEGSQTRQGSRVPSLFGRKRSTQSSSEIPGCFVFGSVGPKELGAKRAKFNMERREEVARIRERGACLRCRYLKLPV